MKVLFLLAYYTPETAASIYLFENVIEALIQNGHKVELIVPIPSRGIDSSINIEYRKRLKEFQFDGKLHIRRFKMPMEGKNTIRRFLRYFLSCFKYYRLAVKSKNIAAIFCESTPPILGLAAALINKRHKVPLIYNLQDIFPDSLVLTGLTHKDSIFWKIGRIIENYTYKQSDHIITISNDFKKNILAKQVPLPKISVVYNWVDESAVINIPRKNNKLFDRYQLKRNKFYITYNGNIGLSQNMDMLLEVAKDIEAYKDIQFVIVGDGTYLENLKQSISEQNIKNIILLPFQPYEDISHVFSLGDVSLVISKPGTGEGCVPSKTWSIMSASRPVLANFDENELKTIIENNNCGIFTKAGDKKAFIDAILKLYNNRELCEEYGRNGREFILKNLTRAIGTQKYVDIIKSVVENKN